MFYPKNPDPSYGNTRPSVSDMPGASKQGQLDSPWHPKGSKGKCCFQTPQNHHIFHQIAQGVFLIDRLILIIYTPQND